MDQLDAAEVRTLASAYRARALRAEPVIARILREIAEDLDDEARKVGG